VLSHPARRQLDVVLGVAQARGRGLRRRRDGHRLDDERPEAGCERGCGPPDRPYRGLHFDGVHRRPGQDRVLDVDRALHCCEAAEHELGVLGRQDAGEPGRRRVALDRPGAGVDDAAAACTWLDVHGDDGVADADGAAPGVRTWIAVAPERAGQGAPHLERRHVDLHVGHRGSTLDVRLR
jgi:hypothetical protein